MKSLLSVTILLLGFVGFHGQQRMSTALRKDVRIEPNKPSVYITFERVGQLKSPDPGDDKERVWLRFHNNTGWPITLDMSGVPSKEYGDAELYYDVLSGRELVVHLECHVCSHNPLSARKSFVFSIPREELSAGRALRVSFSYGWEDWNDVSGGREAAHYVLFDASNLPESSDQSKK
jgi:hypothetical protein